MQNKSRTGMMHSRKGRILFIEDEHNLVDMYHLYFEKKGFDFLTTKDIKEALVITEFEQPDAVLLDIIIPKPENTIAEQGYEFLEAVKKNQKTKDVPIVVFTNLDTVEDRVKCKKMGAETYIMKSRVTPLEVIKEVNRIIEKYKKLRK